jgi:hypothetical protein
MQYGSILETMDVARWGNIMSIFTRHWLHIMISIRSTAEALIMKV